MEGQEENTSTPTPSFGDLLAQSRSDAPTPEPTPEPSEAAPSEPAPTETAAPEAPAPTPEPQATAPAPTPEPPPPPVTPAVDDKARGLIAALQAERQKRQEAEALAQQLQGTSIPEDQAQAQLAAVKNQLLRQSETLARMVHKDYDEVYREFEAEAVQNPALALSVLNSEVPAEAAYQAGMNLRMAKKYGAEVVGNPLKLKEAIEADIRKDEREKAIKEFEAKLTAKAAERSKTPTDITQARAAGGGATPEYVDPGFGGLLRSVHKRK